MDEEEPDAAQLISIALIKSRKQTIAWRHNYLASGDLTSLGEGGSVPSLGEGVSEVTATFCAT